jgi:hypothetical protein
MAANPEAVGLLPGYLGPNLSRWGGGCLNAMNAAATPGGVAMGTVLSLFRNHRPSVGARRRWRDLSTWERAAVVTLGPIELALTATAALDLYRRPQDCVRGAKALWWPAIFIQPIGPITYLVFGRRD